MRRALAPFPSSLTSMRPCAERERDLSEMVVVDMGVSARRVFEAVGASGLDVERLIADDTIEPLQGFPTGVPLWASSLTPAPTSARGPIPLGQATRPPGFTLARPVLSPSPLASTS